MAINKVILNGVTKVDMTSDTANASRILTPYTAHIADGTQAIGTALGSSYTLLNQKTVEISTTSTSATSQAQIFIPDSYWSAGQILYVQIRDTAGKRNNYFLGSDNFFFVSNAANGTTTNITQVARVIHYVNSGGYYNSNTFGSSTGYGLYALNFIKSGYYAGTSGFDIYSCYNYSYSKTINSTFDIKVYALSYSPYFGNPYNYAFTGPIVFGGVRLNDGANEGGNLVTWIPYYAANGTWLAMSAYGACSASSANANLLLPNRGGANEYGYASLQVDWRNAILVDLTAGYGSGSEPTQEECDGIIPYFSGTQTVGGVSLTNIITDNNFANTSYWSGYDASYTVSGNVGHSQATSDTDGWPQLYKDGITTTSGHVYYIRAEIKYTWT